MLTRLARLIINPFWISVPTMPFPPPAALSDIRMSRSLSQRRLGELIGRGQAAVTKYESGSVVIPVDVLATLVVELALTDAEALGLLSWAADQFRARRATREAAP